MLPRSFSCRLALCFALVSCAAEGWADEPAAAKPVSFGQQIAPILLKHCAGCHGASEPKGDYRLVNYQTLLKPGESGSAPITPGRPDQSELYRLISSSDADERMPREGDPLSADQIALVRRWIEEQAGFDGPDPQAPLATLVPKQPHPPAPASYRTAVPISALAFRPDGQQLAVGGYHEVTIWDTTTGALLRRIGNVEQQSLHIEYSPDGKLLAVAGGTPGRSGEVSLFDPEQGTLVATLVQLADVAFGATFSPAGDRLAVCSADRAIRVFDLASRAAQFTIEDHADWVLGVAWSPDGAQLASASRDKTCRVFDAKTGESLTTYSGHGDAAYAVAFAADGKSVYSAGADRRLHAWASAGGNAKATFGGSQGGVDGPLVALTFTGGRLFTGSADQAGGASTTRPIWPSRERWPGRKTIS